MLRGRQSYLRGLTTEVERTWVRPVCLRGNKITPTPEMTQKSSSDKFGVEFGFKCAADGPTTGPKLPGPKARVVLDRFLVRPRYTYGQNRPQACPKMIVGSFQGWGWFYDRLVFQVLRDIDGSGRQEEAHEPPMSHSTGTVMQGPTSIRHRHSSLYNPSDKV